MATLASQDVTDLPNIGATEFPPGEAPDEMGIDSFW